MPRPIVILFFLVLMQSCASQHNLVEGRQQVELSENLQYYLYLPDNYFSEENKDFGLLLFLHGGGESGRQLNELTKNGPPKMMADGYPFPFLVLAPQNPYEKQWWDVRAVNQLLDYIIDDYRVDKKRIYLTGLSRGGSAAWEMAVQYPDKFAALAVVCGMAPLPYAHWMNKEMPIWVFHGAEDKVIPVSESDQMVSKLTEIGFDVRYDRYEGVGHNSWGRAYALDSLYAWFNKQKLIE
ncbi:MAG: alpha/beta hydrolase-fold protein [Croceivirga sp.]